MYRAKADTLARAQVNYGRRKVSMTAHPETRYRCDRCGIDAVVPVINAPPQERMAGPEDWLMLRVGSDLSTPPRHLCAQCATAFQNFMVADG